ncbi:YybH family protein [Streptomyces sp. NPDC058291]|uniref:YybH family protein n=1 Tax=Streptomyces sp. NPDC058291 TaxID=3346427 RepID=UPI0036E071DE
MSAGSGPANARRRSRSVTSSTAWPTAPAAASAARVVGLPPGELTVGREAIRALWEKVLADRPRFEPEPTLPTLISDGIALPSTPPQDGSGARAQVVRRQPDGSWLRLLDQPEFVRPGR